MRQLHKNIVSKNEEPEMRMLITFCKPYALTWFSENGYLFIKLVLCLLFLFIAYCSGKAQLPKYYAYLIKGSPAVKNTNGTFRKIRQQDLLYNGDVLVLKTGSELTLVDKNENFILLKPGKKYKVDTLHRINIRKSEGLTKKYLRLLWNELLVPTEDYTVFKKENLIELSGSVSRGKKCNNLIFPVNQMKISEDTIHFKWLQTNDSGVYNFTISDTKGKKLEFPVSDTEYTVKISAIFGQKPGTYCWLVTGRESMPQTRKDSPCENDVPVCFELITKEQEAELVSSLVPENIPNDLARQLYLVNKLEKNSLIYSAINFYAEIIKANPENRALLKSYVFFLLKYRFNEEALSVWNDLKK